MNPQALDSHEPAKKSQPTGIIEVFRRWWFVPILLFALVEWLLHTWQTRTVMTDEDWADIRTYLQAETKPEDLIVLAPPWLDPVGRMHLGDNLMTEKRVARADESRFPRAFEVSLDNARLPFTRTWKQDHHQRIGPFHLRSFHNPEYQPILHDLVDHAQGTALEVSIGTPEKQQPCSWRHGSPITGPLGFGPAVPANRYHCPRNQWVGVTINPDLDYAPRRCIQTPAPSSPDTLELRFQNVRFGSRIQGHHALYVEAERDGKGAPIRIEFLAEGKSLGEANHHDAEGWTSFSFDTPHLSGQKTELIVAISSTGAQRKLYCFEATTR